MQIEKLRRLTFSHSFEASNIRRESTWQAILENGEALRRPVRKDPKYVTHGIHAYKGKFYPQLARSLFNLAGLSGTQTVLDPFCGSGTVPLEAYLHGLVGIGFDMNPLAVKIAKAKTEILAVDPYLRDRLLAQLQHRIPRLSSSTKTDVFYAGTFEEIQSWFPPRVIRKLAALISAIRDVPEIRVQQFLEVLLSNIVREVSQQDPQDLRIRRRDPAISDAPVFESYLEHLREQRRRLSEFAARSNKAPCKFLQPRIFLGDSRDKTMLRGAGLLADQVDSVVTSPPYATALPYIDTDRLSILLLMELQATTRSEIEASLTGSREIRKQTRREIEIAIEGADFPDVQSRSAQAIVSKVYELNKNANVGFRRKNMAALLYRYFGDVTKVIRNVDSCLKLGGSAFFVIGDSVTVAGGQEVAIRSADVLAETAEEIGWEIKQRIPITVTTEKRPHTRNSITKNDIIWCEKVNGR